MKIFQLIEDLLRQNADDFAKLVLLFVILPLALSIFIGFTFTPDSETAAPKITIEFQDEDQTEISKTFIDALKQLGWFQDDSSPSFVLNFPKGFGDGLIGEAEDVKPTLLIQGGGSSGEQLITMAVEDIAREFRIQHSVGKSLEKKGLPPEKILSIHKNLLKIAEDSQELLVPEVMDSTGDSLKTLIREKTAAGYIGYILILFALSAPSSSIMMKKTGLDKRIGSTPSKASQHLLANIVTDSLVAVVIFLLYLGIHRLAFQNFSGNFFLHLLIVVCYAFFITAVGNLLNVLIPNPEYLNIFFSLFILIQSITAPFGAAELLEEQGGMMNFISKLRVDQHLLVLMDRNRQGIFSSADSRSLIYLVLGGIVITALSLFFADRKKEVLQ